LPNSRDFKIHEEHNYILGCKSLPCSKIVKDQQAEADLFYWVSFAKATATKTGGGYKKVRLSFLGVCLKSIISSLRGVLDEAILFGITPNEDCRASLAMTDKPTIFFKYALKG